MPGVTPKIVQTRYTLRSLDVCTGKNSQTRTLRAGVTGRGTDTTALELAVQRISLDPKVTSGRWWAIDSEI
ncbi:hypothetical protein [Subtercola sp. RTI3]|uniref:hypothetical protein n=1 Tax=Subtercola sp. RTI3 TaxID=3048639 RepID=UPI003A599A1E